MSFAVTAKLVCVFVFAYAKSRFSHDEAQNVINQILKKQAIFSKSCFILSKSNSTETSAGIQTGISNDAS